MGCASSQDKPGKKRTQHAHNSKDEPKPRAANPEEAFSEYTKKSAAKNFGLTKHTIIKPLGVGGTGETWLVKRNDTGQEEAVKVIARGPLLRSLQRLLTNEITLQAEIGEGHFNIVDAHEVLLTESHLCLFMEYIAGGTLTDYVSCRCDTTDQRGGLFLDEMEARFLFRQCIEAVDYCHKKNVAHRDLKLDNTLLDRNDPPRLKICDFGFARLMGSNSQMTTGLGTAVYMAPQMIKQGLGGYDGKASDVWSCGVLLYVMLLGAFPFEHSTAAADEQRAFNEVHFEQIRIHWTANERNKDIVKRMSPACMDLLDRIFRISENERITVPEIKQHQWYTEPLTGKYAAAWKVMEDTQVRISKENDLARGSGGSPQREMIKKVVECACMQRSANLMHPELEDKELFLTRMHAKVQAGVVALPEDVATEADMQMRNADSS
jgi:serine/threonine-protein kinase SRK2